VQVKSADATRGVILRSPDAVHRDNEGSPHLPRCRQMPGFFAYAQNDSPWWKGVIEREKAAQRALRYVLAAPPVRLYLRFPRRRIPFDL